MSEVSLYTGLQQLSGSRYTEANHVGDVIDNDLLRTAADNGVALPTAGQTDREKYHGAVVFDPKAGLHRNVSYPDYSSLYPNGMRDVNTSPETLVGVSDEHAHPSNPRQVRAAVQSVIDGTGLSLGDVRWGYIDPRPVKHVSKNEVYSEFTDGEYKMVYDPHKSSIKWRDDWSRVQDHLVVTVFLSPEHKMGLLPSRADEYIRWNKSYEGTMYSATKRQRNGLYGVSGDSNFRLFDWRVAETITIIGRLLLEYGREVIIERLQSTFDDEAVYVTHGDTDGFGVAVDTDASRGHVLPRVQDATEWLNETGMPQFVEQTFGVPADETVHAVDLESYSPRLFIPDDGDGGVKKTYAERVTWDEGEQVDELDITGFEAKRSDTSDITAEVQTTILEAILYDGRLNARETAYEAIREAVDRIEAGEVPLRELGDRSGLGKDPSEYGTPSRTAHPTYRGAKYANTNIEGERIEAGDNVFTYPIERVADDSLPSTYDTDCNADGDLVDAISVEDPTNLPDGVQLDRGELVDSLVRSPMDNILRGMGWSWSEAIHDHEQTQLGGYKI